MLFIVFDFSLSSQNKQTTAHSAALATSKKMNETEKLEIKKILESIPNEFRVIENKINSKVIDEYYKIADSLENENLTEISQSQSTELESLKVLLVYLSEIGDVKSYRKIEEIIKNGKTDILEFSYVALKFARLNLENNLSDEPIGFISFPS